MNILIYVIWMVNGLLLFLYLYKWYLALKQEPTTQDTNIKMVGMFLNGVVYLVPQIEQIDEHDPFYNPYTDEHIANHLRNELNDINNKIKDNE